MEQYFDSLSFDFRLGNKGSVVLSRVPLLLQDTGAIVVNSPCEDDCVYPPGDVFDIFCYHNNYPECEIENVFEKIYNSRDYAASPLYSAFISGAGKLPAKSVIHCKGAGHKHISQSFKNDDNHKNPRRKIVENSLKLADKNGLESICFRPLFGGRPYLHEELCEEANDCLEDMIYSFFYYKDSRIGNGKNVKEMRISFNDDELFMKSASLVTSFMHELFMKRYYIKELKRNQ